MNYEQSNVGLGMVPHKKSCRCDECEVERLTKRCSEQYFQGGQDMESKLLPEIERLTAERDEYRLTLKALDADKQERLEAENAKLQAAIEHFLTNDVGDSYLEAALKDTDEKGQ